MNYIDVILPLPLPGTFTYLIPDGQAGKVTVGCRVVVPFGKRKFYTGIICKIHHETPGGYEMKEILYVLDEKPIILPYQLKFWQWIADYYYCTIGDVYKAALPSGLKLESETVVVYNPDFEASGRLSSTEQTILDLLSVENEQPVTQLQRKSGIKNILPAVKSLLDKEALLLKEELRKGFKAKVETRVSLNKSIITEDQLKENFDNLAKAPRQLSLLLKYLEIADWHITGCKNEVTKKELLFKSGSSPAVFNALTDKGILQTYTVEIGRLSVPDKKVIHLHALNQFQQKAISGIRDSFEDKQVCLLHGVTSSGKTEIFTHLIEETIRKGKQVLYLLPEIALTTQITERLQRVFGSRLGIYHSKFPDTQRVEVWQKQMSDKGFDIILGVRSSIFLPFKNLGLIIVDEEHENTYKQQEPAPRYHARSAAIVLASLLNAKTLLATATPSVESYSNAKTGKYGLVELHVRYNEILLPEIIPVDIKELARKKRMNGHFSPLLVSQIRKALDNKEQVILFQNRRGFAPLIECKTCGWVPKCHNCDVSLTYHKGINQLTCHYCGYTFQPPRVCPACEGTELINRGFGTEMIEDDIRLMFPEATVARMDLDTAKTRASFERIINDFQEGRTDILIGTQMVSKGLDFDHVSVVGILNADSMLNYPDFRSYERAYQLMAQVAGRAGRKKKRGTVVLQTKSMDHPIIGQVMRNDYVQMVYDQLAERQIFHYPPFYRLIYIYLKHRNESLLDTMAKVMAQKLQSVFGNRILGPDKPPVARVQSLYIRKIVVKVEPNAPVNQVRELIYNIQREMILDERFKSLVVYYDVDPM